MLSRVLIVSYFYPPCNLTASRRPASWVRHLPQFGFKPVVVTRRWDHAVAVPSDMFIPSGTDLVVEWTAESEIRRVPFRASLRDRIYVRYGESAAVMLRKALSLGERLLELGSTRLSSYRGLLNEVRATLDADHGIRQVVITGGPFPLFGIGHAISRSHPHVRWIADYRDEWTTCSLRDSGRGVADGWLRSLQRRAERSWVGTASMVTTVNEDSLQRIIAHTGRAGVVLLNGFDEESLAVTAEPPPAGVFRITHAGTLYPSQPIEIFLQGAMAAMRDFEGRVRIEVQFPGLGFSAEEAERVKRMVGAMHDRFLITPRISHREAVALEKSSHVLLLVGHQGRRDVPSSKLYEYVGLRKAVLLCPSDSGVMERTLRDCGLGHVAPTAEDVRITLTKLIEGFLSTGSVAVEPVEIAIEAFGRLRQAERLAQLLRSMEEAVGVT